MSDEENENNFSEDDRVKFVGGQVCQILQVKQEIWDKCVAIEPNQKVLERFFEEQNYNQFFITTSTVGLIASKEVRLVNISICVVIFEYFDVLKKILNI